MMEIDKARQIVKTIDEAREIIHSVDSWRDDPKHPVTIKEAVKLAETNDLKYYAAKAVVAMGGPPVPEQNRILGTNRVSGPDPDPEMKVIPSDNGQADHIDDLRWKLFADAEERMKLEVARISQENTDLRKLLIDALLEVESLRRVVGR